MNRVFIPLNLPQPDPVPADAVVDSLSGLTMGTSWSVRLIRPAGCDLKTMQDGIQRQLDLVVAQMSTWSSDSDLSRYNHAAADSWQVLPEHFLKVLDCALAVAELSGGAYDPSVGPLVNLWGFGPDPKRSERPDDVAIARERQRCGWQRIRIDRARHALLQPGDLYLDFSSIAKGYGVDLVAAYLRSVGAVSYLVEVGGELYGQGVKADGQPWWAGMEHPPAAAGADEHVQSIAALHGVALATSGDYRRYFDDGERRYSHTIDPRTAQPVAHALASVAVLHADCMTADAWATALMVLGDEEGLALALSNGVAALFISRDGEGFRERLTPAMQAMLG
ncbi:FAD:protein FMN transferase [Herbaspirillum rhizosphaerae]|uniref:FAD:protein FMN transferase n=1 Tax=Herbaspirillum rhizosphaerae TaxID=346179 RepID=UPI00067B3FF2|nr:FAD:protein FMN transferase [Herbaspirillum rhizosphaerae]